MHSFWLLTLVGWSLMVGVAAVLRGRRRAMFMGIIIGIYSLIAVALAPALSRYVPLYVIAALHVSVYVNFIMFARPRMRSLWYRLVVSWPSAFFAAGTLLALPWALLTAVGLHPWGPWIPYAAAAIGLLQSLTTKKSIVDLVVVGPDGERAAHLAPYRVGASPRTERPLRIVQISDPHLGPFMSVARLRRIAERAVLADPDLVLLTGDFLTMESNVEPDLLLRAFEPFQKLSGRVFACNGNHDHEAPEIVKRALRENGITLLVDDAREVETKAGPVQILGMDFVWGDRQAHLARVCAAHPRKPGVPRIVLLHDPGAFKHLPDGEGDLVLSGHTHGGQVGLVSIGLAWTFLRLGGVRLPDHGFWARGTDRMYVHRGTGHYGFPLRLGVPAEESVLNVHLPMRAGVG